jgi:hypothetical protein
MTKLIPVLISILIIGLFLFSKLLPYKDKLSPQYRNIFNFFSRLFLPVFSLLKKFFKPLQVGQGLLVDMTQVVLLIILLFILNLF